MYKLIH